jgi:hypothetical protein
MAHYFWNLKQNSLFPNVKKDLFDCMIHLSFFKEGGEQPVHSASLFFVTTTKSLAFAEFERVPLNLNRQQYEKIADILYEIIPKADAQGIKSMGGHVDYGTRSITTKIRTKPMESEPLIKLLYMINTHPNKEEIHDNFDKFISLWL